MNSRDLWNALTPAQRQAQLEAIHATYPRASGYVVAAAARAQSATIISLADYKAKNIKGL
jgi:hypothetical protein